jgi:hypothetical protein
VLPDLALSDLPESLLALSDLLPSDLPESDLDPLGQPATRVLRDRTPTTSAIARLVMLISLNGNGGVAIMRAAGRIVRSGTAAWIRKYPSARQGSSERRSRPEVPGLTLGCSLSSPEWTNYYDLLSLLAESVFIESVLAESVLAEPVLEPVLASSAGQPVRSMAPKSSEATILNIFI